MSKPGVMIYFDLMPALKRLSSAEKGELLDAILEYGQFGAIPEFDGMLGVAWDFIQPRIDSDNERYNTKCKQARNAANERWSKDKQTDADVCERKQADANNANSTTTQLNNNYNSTPTTNSTSISNAAEKRGCGGEKPSLDYIPRSEAEFEKMREEKMRMLSSFIK